MSINPTVSKCPSGCDLRPSDKVKPGDGPLTLALGIDLPDVYDGTVLWYCPKCGAIWLREGMERFADHPTVQSYLDGE